MLSVVVLNFNRPNFIKYNILPTLEKYKEIDEIIISNGKESTAIQVPNAKCLDHTGEVNDIYGLTLRFFSALEAKNDNILIIDDDIIPSEETVKELVNFLLSEPNRLHGIYGRNFKNGSYSYENVFGEVPMVLTRCLVCKKEMCQYFMDNFRKYENELVKNSKPYWNGEDILFSLLSIKKYGKLPMAYDMGHYNRIANYINVGEAISMGNEHESYRKEASKYFIYELDLAEKIKLETKVEKTKEQLKYFAENSNLYILFLIGFLILSAVLCRKIYQKNEIE
jgi:hypothetical protein